jgi:hypothetical protein
VAAALSRGIGALAGTAVRRHGRAPRPRRRERDRALEDLCRAEITQRLHRLPGSPQDRARRRQPDVRAATFFTRAEEHIERRFKSDPGCTSTS